MASRTKETFRNSRLGRYCPIPQERPVWLFVLGYPIAFGFVILQTTGLLYGANHALWAGFLTLLFWAMANALWIGAFFAGALPLVLVGSVGSLLFAVLKTRSVKPLQERLKKPADDGEDLLLCLIQKAAWMLVVVPSVPLLLVLALSVVWDFPNHFWHLLTAMWFGAGIGALLLARRGYLLPFPNSVGSEGGF
jgi:hypothetical protein